MRQQGDTALAGATPYLRLFANTAGGALLAREALAARLSADAGARVATARFFAEHMVPAAASLEREVVEGAGSINDAALDG
jgi:hypothetical protein